MQQSIILTPCEKADAMTSSASPRCNSKCAFTLIELSIVLVIIGLIVGGVMVGKDMIHASQIRDILSTKDRFNAAVNTFKLTYNALPGDMANATHFWGADASCPQTPHNVIPKVATCNSNGRGEVGHFPGFTYYPSSIFYKETRF